MLTRVELGNHVADLGLLLGLLIDEGDNKVSVNKDWFAQPVAELEKSPTRVKELLNVLSHLFDPADGTQYMLHDPAETWYSIFSGYDELPTGLCLIAPPTGSTSGLVSLGLFHQFVIDELTISLHARLPLFYLAEGQTPQFVLTSGLTEHKKLSLELDVYSAAPVQVGTDAPFNMVSVAATAEFSDTFKTDFALSFYQEFEPQTGNKTLLPTAERDAVIARLAELVLRANFWLNSYIGDAPLTIGEILSVTGLVTQTVDPASGQISYHFDQHTFDSLSKDPTEVLKKFLISLLTKLLDELASTQTLLLPIHDGGIYATKDAATHTYGLRLAIPGYVITSAAGTGPHVTVELGKWFTSESGGQNWIRTIAGEQVDPGIDIFFLKYDGQKLSTTANIKFASLGLDISGRGDAPLIDVRGYTLKRAELRAYMDSASMNYGFAVRLDEVGFPLGPGFEQAQHDGAGANTVGKSLLASGSEQSDSSNSKETSAVNPGFSAEAGYIAGHAPMLQIFDAQGNKTDLIWFPIQRRFGPVNCQKVGLKVAATGTRADDPVLGVVFDGNVSLAALDIYLDELSINVHLKKITDVPGYEIDLQGLAVTFNGGGVELSGGLVKTVGVDKQIAYDGEVLIKTAKLTVTAVGSFSSLPDGGGTSLFVFAMLNYPLGGPPFFYVTGLAAGFGYNRTLKIPAESEVQNFPLVAGLAKPALIGGEHPDPKQALLALQDWVKPARGEYWLAAGVQFTTFEIINTNALLIVQFGKEVTISLLGLSTLKQPATGDSYAYAELGIRVVLMPEVGEFKASAVLAPSSYLMTPEAHLTGGFAFYAWFGSNEHAGDFAFTIGGYHPAFKVPEHYPQEPRVGINWQVSDKISIVGSAYFAITPATMMAGVAMQLTFTDGNLKAWLKAQTDFILYWKPFYLLATASISIGISYRIDTLFVHTTLSVEISVDLSLWGPPMGGRVHVDWYIISFTISFGPDPTPPADLKWEDFKGLLPSKTQELDTKAKAVFSPGIIGEAVASAPFAPASEKTTQPALLSINANDGLRSTQTRDGLTLWLVRAGQFKFNVASALPASAVVVESQDAKDNYVIKGQPVGMRRVNGGIAPNDYRSTQTVAILQLKVDGPARIKACMATTNPCATQPAGCDSKPIIVTGWQIEPTTMPLPQAMWGDLVPSGQEPDINPSKPTINGTVGVTMNPKPPVVHNCTPEMVINQIFADRIVNASDEYWLLLSPTQPPSGNTPRPADSFVDIAAVNSPPVVRKRNALFAALLGLGVNAWTNEPLPHMAATPGRAFADEPMAGSVV
jgi:hypothetical protein